MYNFSNLYASRVFAEHPIALWSLDDEAYFYSLLSPETIDVENWTIINGHGEWTNSYISPRAIPLRQEPKGVLRKTSSASVSYTEIRPTAIPVSSFDSEKETISVTAFAYAYGDLIDNYEIGFIYSNGSVDKTIYNSAGLGSWQKFEYRSTIPSGITNARPFIKINYLPGGSLPDYDVMINGVSVGHWPELYTGISSGTLGSLLQINDITDLIPDVPVKIFPVDAYGFNDSDTGYFVIDGNRMLAHNNNLPMIYGAGNITEIVAPVTPQMPAAIFPGKGFLNKNGQYSNITAEFWIRLNPSLTNETRIFGPLSSKDGLYVDYEFLTLKVGKYSKSYFVGKWYRPMLIDIRYTPNLVSVLINGDVVIELDIDISNINFARNNYDWIGFYGNEDIRPFEIDCLAIYPYVVPDQVAKRRFIYAQGVQNIEAVSNNFLGEFLPIDFPFANYASTINYPDMNPWNSGYFNNLDSNSKYIGLKEYVLPNFRFLGEGTVFTSSANPRTWTEFNQQDWINWISQSWTGVITEEVSDIYTDNFLIQNNVDYPFLKIRPNNAYVNIDGSLEFDSINPISDRVSSIHGVFEAPTTLDATPQTLMYFYNSLNNNNLKITIDSSGLKYLYNDILLNTESVSASSKFSAGIDIDKLNINYSNIIGNFFSNPKNISLSFMGYSTSTFLGKFYSLTFNNSFFNQKDMGSHFDFNGFANPGAPSEYFTYVGNYTLKPVVDSSSLILDVSSAGYWEDSLPLSYFGKIVKDKSGLEYYDLDMIQFNLEYPSQILTDPSSSPSYYDDINVKAYMTLQNIDEVGLVSYSNYSNIEKLSSTKVIDFDNTVDVINTKFEIADGTIIFPPKELVNFSNYYINIHLEIKSKGVNTKPIRIKRMSLSSIVSDENNFFEINTRTGNKIYPITRYERSYSYKEKNPFFIYKDSTPYLYLTSDSGISILPYPSNSTRGISIPINSKKVQDYSLGGFQFWGMYNKDLTIDSVKKIARVSTQDRSYDFYLEPIDDGKRGLVRVFDSETGLENPVTVFYQNGQIIKNPIVEPLVWTSIIVSFGDTIILNATSGQLEFYEGFLYNNFAIYEKSTDILGQSVDARSWQDIRTAEVITEDGSVYIQYQWEDWLPLNWSSVYSLTNYITYTIDGNAIMSSYLGNSSIVSEDNAVVELNSDGVDLISDVVWDTIIVKPV